MSTLPVQAIAHWALKTHDAARLLGFYRDALGFAEMMRLNRDDGSLWLVYLRVTDTQFLEIFPDGVEGPAPSEDASAVNHICLAVDSVDDTARWLEDKGIAMFRAPKLGADGNRQCWIKDPDGNRIEFMQMLPGNMQEEAITRLQAARRSP
jgi:lactoylglutathione lyase